MVSETTKQMITPILLESPLLAVLVLRDWIQQYAYRVAWYNPELARLIFIFVVIAAGFVTGFLALLVMYGAQKAVAGKRFLVGFVYDRRGLAQPIQLELGEYSEIGKVRSDSGEEWLVYAVWRMEKDTRVIDYVLLTKERLEDALSAASVWDVFAGGWYAKAQAYPVTLLRAEAELIDVFREDAGLPPNVPVYFLRDYPGRLTKKLQEEVNKGVRRVERAQG